MAAAWRDVVQQRALEVAVRCSRARRQLAVAAALLAPPMLAAEAPAVGSRIYLVLLSLVRASDDLELASNATNAAEIVALSGAAADPATPLPSIEDIPDGDRDARLALRQIRSARDRAVAACDFAGRCCGHLLATSDVLYLNDASGFHELDGFLEVQHGLATANLDAALASSLVSAALAVVANGLVR